MKGYQVLFLLLIAFLGGGLLWISMSKYGPGITTDGINYLSAAYNLSRGNGLYNFSMVPMTLWAPGYPIVLGLLSIFFQTDVLTVGLYLNIILFMLTITLTGIFVRDRMPNSPIWMYAASIMVAVSVSFVSIYSSILSEPLFIILLFSFWWAGCRYLEDDNIKIFILLIVISGISPLERYIGVTMVMTGVALIFWKYYPNIRQTLKFSLIYGTFSSLPFLIWMVGRNYQIDGSFLGPREFYKIQVWENFNMSFNKIIYWFVPNYLRNRVPIFLIIVLISLALIYFNRGEKLQRLQKQVFLNKNFPILLFSLIYFIFTQFITITEDHINIEFDDRFYIIIFFPVILLIFFVIDEFFLSPLGREPKKYKYWVLSLAFIVWLSFPIFKLNNFINQSLEDGVAFYNIYNSDYFLNNSINTFMSETELESGSRIFSNYPQVVYLNEVGLRVLNSPADYSNPNPSLKHLQEEYSNWAQRENTYLVWFLPNNKDAYYPPDDLAKFFTLTPIYSAEDGIVYRVSP